MTGTAESDVFEEVGTTEPTRMISLNSTLDAGEALCRIR